MIRVTQYPIFTSREDFYDIDCISHRLLLKSGMIKMISSGIYTWMPLGLRVLRKLENLIREEMNMINSIEILMPVVHDSNLWKQTERWDTFGEQLLKFCDKSKHEFCLGATHEEIVTYITSMLPISYKQLPFILYQIQTKFRDEIRPKSGIIRAKEFIMKDAYSFHIDEKSLQDTYMKIKEAYIRILDRLELKYYVMSADSGNMGGSVSDEFLVVSDAGEDIIYIDKETNIPYREYSNGRIQKKCIEIGHIFQLGQRYSNCFNLTCKDNSNIDKVLYMGCYGIGVSRLIASIIEQKHDEKGIIFPKVVSPFEVAIAPIGINRSELVRKESERLYREYTEKGTDILFYDTGENIGKILTDLELIGIYKIHIISEKNIMNSIKETKIRESKIIV